MGRHTGNNSRGFDCVDTGGGDYEISWVVDYYYPSSRLRHPRVFRRWTDANGAKRFCKKHDIYARRYNKETRQYDFISLDNNQTTQQ